MLLTVRHVYLLLIRKPLPLHLHQVWSKFLWQKTLFSSILYNHTKWLSKKCVGLSCVVPARHFAQRACSCTEDNTVISFDCRGNWMLSGSCCGRVTTAYLWCAHSQETRYRASKHVLRLGKNKTPLKFLTAFTCGTEGRYSRHSVTSLSFVCKCSSRRSTETASSMKTVQVWWHIHPSKSPVQSCS